MSNLISYPDFSNNFIIHIRSIEVGHTDETGTYDYGVGFNVICLTNNRVMFFESHLNANTLPVSYTEQDIIDKAWSNLQSDVKSWATTAITLPSLIGSFWIPPTNLAFTSIGNFTFDIYKANFTTQVSTFEVYPPNEPASWHVGFNIISNYDSQSLYIDTIVKVNTLAITRAEDEILGLAWINIKEQIAEWTNKIFNTSHLINTVFVAPNNNW